MFEEAVLKQKDDVFQTPLLHDPTKPSQEAVNGAFDGYVEGGKKNKQRLTTRGFFVLRHATDEQLRAAIPFVQKSHGMSDAKVTAVLTPPNGRVAS